jgi:putative phosphonate catabolism associated alcohol dehydrogenase
MPKSMAVVFQRAGVFENRTFEIPVPQGVEILVRVLGCTLCGSDLHTFHGRRQVAVPSILGHEIVGQILAFGSDVAHVDLRQEQLEVGDRVSWAIVANCDNCFYCERGVPQKCVQAVKYGHEPLRPGRELLGGLAQHCLLVAGTKLMRWSPDVPLAVACPASCATATAMAALQTAGDVNGRTVAVLGAGMLGLTTCAIAASRGAAQIVCIDPVAERRERAKLFGATSVSDVHEFEEMTALATSGRGFDVAIEMAGTPAAFDLGFSQLRIGGKFVLIGAVFPSPPVPLPMEQIVRRCLTIQGVHNYTPADFACAVEFLNRHHNRFPFESLVAAWWPLADVDKALTQAAQPSIIRVGITC